MAGLQRATDTRRRTGRTDPAPGRADRGCRAQPGRAPAAAHRVADQHHRVRRLRRPRLGAGAVPGAARPPRHPDPAAPGEGPWLAQLHHPARQARDGHHRGRRRDARGEGRPQRLRRHRGRGRPHPPAGRRCASASPTPSLVEALIRVLDPNVKFGILSDIDDTVMVTALPRPLLAAWNTFVLDEHARAAVPGMAVLYERLVTAHPGAPVFYLSTGAWNVAPTLTRFLSRHLYPAGPLLLTDWGPTADRWFRSGREHKRATLARLSREFPDVRWLLIGDDGQHDPEIYREFAAGHPDNVAGVAIRRLSPTQSVLAGSLPAASGSSSSGPVGQKWLSAPDGAGLWKLLRDAGLV
ncbi:hypothetical protein MCAG_04691 [Micromonospora sp. ATCC 39149]|nr:hypothetical protein MCAG_04691 [Micromonospora sp. ATCC 39149]